MTDFDAKTREIVAGYDGCSECLAKIAAALKAAYNDGLEAAAAYADVRKNFSSMGDWGSGEESACRDIAEQVRTKKVQP